MSICLISPKDPLLNTPELIHYPKQKTIKFPGCPGPQITLGEVANITILGNEITD